MPTTEYSINTFFDCMVCALILLLQGWEYCSYKYKKCGLGMERPGFPFWHVTSQLCNLELPSDVTAPGAGIC